MVQRVSGNRPVSWRGGLGVRPYVCLAQRLGCCSVGSGEAVGVLWGRVGYRVCTQKALSEGSVGS